MPQEIIHGGDEQRQAVDFEDSEVTIEDRPSQKKRLALVNLPWADFDLALAEAARNRISSIKAVG